MFAKHLFYTGRVQGVGFRYSVKQIASGFEVTGWVKNLPDGRVELLACCYEEEELDAFLTEIEDSNLAPLIKETESEVVDPPKNLTGFTISR